MNSPVVSAPDFRRAPWLVSRHLETVAAALSSRPKVQYQRRIVQLPDRDEIALDFIVGQPRKPVVALFHGLEGCSQSRSLRVFAHGFARMGWSVAAPHFRSCGGHMNKLPRAYHAGDHVDIQQLLRQCQSAIPNAQPLFAIGVSLGANALIKHLANRDPRDTIVRAAMAVSVPHNLALSAKALDQKPLNRALYARHFLKSLRKKIARKGRQFPDQLPGLRDPRIIRRIRRIADFDQLYTAPVHGFASADDYWEKASCGDEIPKVKIPLLCVNALNDPLAPANTLIPPETAPAVVFRRPKHGGHGAFIGSPPDWLFQQAREFFQTRL